MDRRTFLKVGMASAVCQLGPSAVSAQTAGERGGWTQGAPLPQTQSDSGGGVLQDRLYYFGGFKTGVGLKATSRAFVYDPHDGPAGRWRRIQNMPRSLWGVCGVATATELYSFGGAPTDSPYNSTIPPSRQIFVYRPGSGWENLTKNTGVRCPYRNWGMGAVYNPVDGLIYCMGGATTASSRDSVTDHGAKSDNPGKYDESRIWTFDPTTGRIENRDLARMPVAKRWHTVALVTVGGRQYIHAIGGRLGIRGYTASNFRFDIQRRRWQVMTAAPRPANFGTTNDPVVNNKVYLTHGFFKTGSKSEDDYLLKAYEYDPEQDEFKADLARPKHPRVNAVAGVIDGKLYVVGGHIKRYSSNRNHDCQPFNEVYTPAG